MIMLIAEIFMDGVETIKVNHPDYSAEIFYFKISEITKSLY